MTGMGFMSTGAMFSRGYYTVRGFSRMHLVVSPQALVCFGLRLHQRGDGGGGMGDRLPGTWACPKSAKMYTVAKYWRAGGCLA